MTQLDEHFLKIYNSLKIMLYNKSLKSNSGDDPHLLTLQEIICMEIIVALKRPTISEFSKAANISGSNSAYRIRKLIDKGYVVKIQNPCDKREFYLEATDKYEQVYGLSQSQITGLSSAVNDCFSKEDLELLNRMLEVMDNELQRAVPETLRDEEA